MGFALLQRQALGNPGQGAAFEHLHGGAGGAGHIHCCVAGQQAAAASQHIVRCLGDGLQCLRQLRSNHKPRAGDVAQGVVGAGGHVQHPHIPAQLRQPRCAHVGALADPAKRAAIVQYLDRLARAGDWALAHREAYAQVYTQLTRLPIEASRIITGRAAIAARPVTQADVTALQTVADRSARDGILPARVDVVAITDAQVWRGAA